METFLSVFIVVAIFSVILTTVAIWFLVLRVSKTLESVEKNIEKMVDDMEKSLQNVESITKKINGILTPVEGIAKLTPLIGFLLRFTPFIKKTKKS